MKTIWLTLFILIIGVGCTIDKNKMNVENIEKKMMMDPSGTGELRVFYIDPLEGDINNDGSIDSPWDTLENVLRQGYVKTKDFNGNILNENGYIQAGDIVKLRTGYHGNVVYRNSYNDTPIVFEADEGQKPTLSRLVINSAENLVFKKLIISPEFNENDHGGSSIALFCYNRWFGPCNNIVLMDSFIYSTLDSSVWSRDRWITDASNGISVAGGSSNFKFINNYILNVNSGITVGSPGTLIEGNVVSRYYNEAIRLNTDTVQVKLNVIKDNLNVTTRQSFGLKGYNGGLGFKELLIEGNIFLANENNESIELMFLNIGAGIALYDGPLSSIHISDNVVGVQNSIGISLNDIELSEVIKNTVYNLDEENSEIISKIMFGSKNIIESTDNVFDSNKVNIYSISEDKLISENNNSMVNEDDFYSDLGNLISIISSAYGQDHLLAEMKRVDDKVVSTYITEIAYDTVANGTINYVPSVTNDPVMVSGNNNPTIHYIDPINGDINNSGSKYSPWNTLQEVLSKGYIETKDKNGNVINQGSPVKAGDTIKLMSGYHGDINYRNSHNDELITIEAAEGQYPTLGRLQMHSVKNILFRGLRISPEFSSEFGGGVVILCIQSWFGVCENVSIVDSYIYSAESTANWTEKDWNEKVADGILIGKEGSKINLINNLIFNINFGINISAPDSYVSGNVINNFSADGIRVGANNTIVQFNVIKNSIKVNDNHDDGIQGYGGGKGDLIINNVIISRDLPDLDFLGTMQGIGYFDGPLSTLSVVGNVIDINSYHGIALYDTENSLIAENVTINTQSAIDYFGSWVMIGTRNIIGSVGNKVISNLSNSFNLVADESVVDKDNGIIRLNDYAEKVSKVLNEINIRYGPVANIEKDVPRVSEYYKNKIGAN